MAKRKAKVNLDAARELMEAQFDAEMIGEDPVEVAASSVGLYQPHLCQRFLYQSTIFPFERTILVLGPTGSNKSSYVYSLYNMFGRASGKYLHLETEDKDTPILRLSLTDYNPKYGKAYRCDSMDDFQKKVRDGFTRMGKIASKSGLGWRTPFVIGIDSLTAKMTEEAYKTVDAAEGATKRRYSDEARSLADWFKVATRYLRGKPFSLVCVRHDKPTKNKYGHDVHTGPGGAAPKFYATYEILMLKRGRLKMNADGWEANRIEFSTEKSSLGSDQRKFTAEFAWRPSQRPNKKGDLVASQDSAWNWHKATTELLMRLSNDKGVFGKAVDDIVGIDVSRNRYTSSTLGIKGDQALPPTEFGRLIESCPDLLKELHPRIGIATGNVFDAEIDLPDQLETARQSANLFVAAPYIVEAGDEAYASEEEAAGEEESDGEEE